MNLLKFNRNILLIAALAMISAGCSQDERKYEISGVLTIDGAVPPEGSSISLVPVNKSLISEGCTVKNGQFNFMARPGEYRVEIRAPLISKKSTQKYKSAYQTQGDNVTEMLPTKYNDKSELKLDVKPEKNTVGWNLVTKR